ncbi:hypothetical protein N7491_007867 [Penicillium cf. griseofulvum]|uniref:Uncharacterized protein n=1 Tax=Penicillium cf. griseofulvum TaxID=2972120 RepID=A0A9W9M5K2_9EURO|nr:hypothetical protein N7472_009104 [Penicillium cf. griseofulvum]KAJ5427425.1 hypothetical protein N7491_007867 [Penicillium cf. griseofulvum]KAJ5431625.1 hypothetical protein N7445_008123 [Penicillium cf. griseofulvum]
MSSFHIGWVEPVNGENRPVLTHDEVWKGCLLLARSPQSFTTAISSCEIESDTGNTLTRTLYFSEGPQSKMIQDIILMDKLKFECKSDNGNKVATMIFRGLSESPEDIYLSIDYSIPYANLDTNGGMTREMYTAKCKQNLVDGLKTMRELKAQGKLN